MTADPEFNMLLEEWQSDAAIPLDLRAKVGRQRRLTRAGLALDIVVTIAMGGWTTTWAITSSLGSVILLAVVTWTFIAAAWIFALTNLRGAWAPYDLTVAAFLEFSTRIHRARRRAIVFGAVLWIVEVSFCLGWLLRNYGMRDPLVWGLVCSATVVFEVLCFWYYRKQTGELRALELFSALSPN